MSCKPTANPSVVLREEFDDYALLYDPDRIEVFCLNPVGVFLWKRLDGRHSTEDILGELRSGCNNVPPEADEHLREFIGDLAKHGLISADESQGA
jgi:SynChlorMet cassette protein ScmD